MYINDPANLTQKELKDLLFYDKETGAFIWNVDRNQHVLKGSWAGQQNEEGYIRISLKGRKTYAHRLVWFYVHGVWPDGEIDHINGKPWDNRIENLRVVNRHFNVIRQRVRKTKKSKLPKGVTLHSQSGKYWARFRKKSLGLYSTIEDAVAVLEKIRKEYYGE